MIEYNLVDSCTSTNSYEVKFKNRKIDLKKAEPALSSIGESAAVTPVVLLFKIKGYAVSIYASGRMLIKNISKQDAEALGKELVSALDEGGAVK
ncbi:TPA: hypothetical protein EYP38_03160 [Candidatus Micrarchaeota archaeon]|nr:hypothetical protein [Candidatus Micrarchaeota archaeon]